MVLDILTVVALAFVATRLVGGVRLVMRREVQDHMATIVRGLRARHFLLCWPVLAGVILVASVALYVPGLSWGWWSAIGGVGSPVMGMTERESGSALEWIIPVVFIVMLLPALPLFAEAEERRFRMGAEGWSQARRIRMAMVFGMVHCLIGIPLGVGLALSLGGGYFTWAYLRGYRAGGDSQRAGVLESTRAHLAYNLTVFVIIGAAFALDALVA